MSFFKKIPYKLQFYVPHFILRYIKKNMQLRYLSQWRHDGCPVPPPHIIKVSLLKYLAKKKDIEIFVETGTFMGDMIDEVKNDFKDIYSIELFAPLYERASRLFSNKKNITLLNGDSSKLLRKVIEKISGPTLFWLDAHYSGSGTAKAKIDTPIYRELKIIKKLTAPHIIVIDDARLFNGKNDYPKLSDLKREYRSTYKIDVVHDMIVLVK